MAQPIKEYMTELLSLPKEIVLDLPQIILTGSQEVNIENYKNIIEYTETRIRVNTNSGILLISGHSLLLKQITAEYITVAGEIVKLEYMR